jgi:hypothetical protein
MRFSIGRILRVDASEHKEVLLKTKREREQERGGRQHDMGNMPPPSPRCPNTYLSPPDPSFFKKVPPLPDLKHLDACAGADIDTLRVLDGTLHHPVPETFLRDKQPFVTQEMRSICIGWIMEVQAHFRMRHEIVHRCVMLFDRFMHVCNIKIGVARVQLVLIMCLILACKVEQYRIPKMRLVVSVCDDRYGIKEMRDCERLILKKLDYHVTEPTALHMLGEICAALLLHLEDRQTIFETAAMELDLWLFECRSLRLSPFLRAAAALRFVMKDEWSTKIEEQLQLTHKEIEDIEWACGEMKAMHVSITEEPKSPPAIVLPKFGICTV